MWGSEATDGGPATELFVDCLEGSQTLSNVEAFRRILGREPGICEVIVVITEILTRLPGTMKGVF